jgi:hypothetical protein
MAARRVERQTVMSVRRARRFAGVLPSLAIAAFRRGELRLEGELRWHEEFEREIAAGRPGGPAPLRAVGGASGRAQAPGDAAAPGENGR